MLASLLGQYLRGFLMGSADVVPGVSGGTVALVLGIYHRLVACVREGAHALGALVRLDVREARTRLGRVDLLFLLPLLAGVGTAILALSHTIERLLEDEPVLMAGLFFGLVTGSIVVASRLVRGWDGTRVAVLLGVAVVTFLVLGIRQDAVDDPGLLVVFLSGAVAICAMILPGLSGSFLLLMLGMYDYVLEAVNDRDVVVVAVFGAGCVVGLALFSQVLHWGLVHHERTMLAALIGLMVGALRVLWPWPDGTDGTATSLPEGSVIAPVVAAVAGLVVVLAVTAVAQRLERRDDEDLAEELQIP